MRIYVKLGHVTSANVIILFYLLVFISLLMLIIFSAHSTNKKVNLLCLQGWLYYEFDSCVITQKQV